MHPSIRFQRASQILLELVELEPGRREQALRDYPGLDEALRGEVGSLLRFHDDDGLEGPQGVRLEDPAALDRELGRSVGGHTIVALLGVGGMGSVYEARQPDLERTVALKVVRDLGNEEARQRFRFEIEALTRLGHPNIATIHGAGVDESGDYPRPYFTMELVRGRRIDEHVRDRGLGVEEILGLAVQLCRAIEHAHRRGILHRDIKPGNLLVTEEGLLKVLDFGIARPLAGHDSLASVTRSRHGLLGTLAYMSPEQCTYEAGVADARSDVYSIGAVIYELLTGRPPVDVQGLELVQAARKICEVRPEAPRLPERALPADLSAVLLKALEKEPDQRYDSVSALAEDLIAFREGRPVRARSSRWRRAASWIGRHPLATVTLVSTLIVVSSLGLTAVAIQWLAWRPYVVEVATDGMTARLVSFAGNELHTWDGPVRSVEKLRRADGSPLALLGFVGGQGVEARPFDEPGRLAWSTDGLGYDPPGPDGPGELSLVVEVLVVDDFLPAVPGEEALVVLRLSPYSSWTVVRLLDGEGVVRFEAWHPGAIKAVSWLPEEGRLLCAGYSSCVSWAERGVELADHEWPYVVFALEFTDGQRIDDVDLTQASPGPVAWYRWAGPEETLREMPRSEVILGGAWARRSTEFVVRVLGSTPAGVQTGGQYVAFFLDGDGRELHRLPSTEYSTALGRGEVPPVEAWKLLPLEALPGAAR